jgi:Aminoglycoside-2''-adenylyltransferase
MQRTVDEKTATQLGIIGEVARVGADHNLTVALRGGWALEFLVGHVSRPHVDVDFVAWSHDADRLERALEASGFAVGPAPASYRAVQRDFTRDGEDVQIALLEASAGGTLIPPGHPEWPLSPGLLAGPWMTLEGVTCRVSTADALLDAKEKRPFWGPEDRFSPKDLADMRRLRELITARPSGGEADRGGGGPALGVGRTRPS